MNGVKPKILLFFVKLNPYTDDYKILKLMKNRDKLSKEIANGTKQIRNERNNDKGASYYVDYLKN